MTAGNSRKVRGWTTPIPVQVAETAGSLLSTKSDEVVEEILPGNDGEVLTMVDGVPAWAEAGGGGDAFAPGVISVSASVVTGPGQGLTYGTLLPETAIPVEAANVGNSGYALFVTAAEYAEEWTLTNNHPTHDLGGEVKVIARNRANGDYLSAVASDIYPVAGGGGQVTLNFTQQSISGTSIAIVDGNLSFDAGTYDVSATVQLGLIPPA